MSSQVSLKEEKKKPARGFDNALESGIVLLAMVGTLFKTTERPQR
jgi:hypothetical protein